MGKPITGLLRWRARQILAYNLATARCIVCVSEPARQQLVTNWKVPHAKTVVFPNGVDVDRFCPLPDARREVRATLSLGDGIVFLFVGNFYKWHDVKTLLDAFATVHSRVPNAMLLLVGDGPQKVAMEQRAVELGIGAVVRFTGLVAHREVPRLIAAADVAVAPYPAAEGGLWLSPMKLFEYMASGTATIASAVGQLVDVIDDGRNGLLVPAGDVVGLAGAMQRLAEDRDLRVQLGAQARQDAVRKHSWSQYMIRLERIFLAVRTGSSIQGI
jgi:glycosyltransferase involved in cell wall biosynthesis